MAEAEKLPRMQRFWMWLGLELGKRAGLVAVCGLLITLGLGAGISRLEFATGQDSYLNSDDQVYIDNVEYQTLFGGQAMLVLFTADEGSDIVDIMSPANQAEMDRVADELRAHPDLVDSVITPKTGLLWSDSLIQSDDGNPLNSIAGGALLNALEDDPTEEGKAARAADSAVTLERLGAIPVEDRNLDNAEWVDFLIYDNEGGIRKSLAAIFVDDTRAQMLIRLVGNASIEVEGEGSDLVQQIVGDAEFESTGVTITGAPILLKDINDYLKSGLLTLGAIAIGVMALILLVLFDVRWRLLPLFVIVIGVTWAFGLAGYIGIPLSVVTIAGLPVMLGVGIDYAIQLHSRVEEEVIIERDAHPIQETARNLCPALLVVTFDAVFAFLALRFAEVPMIRDFGLLLAVGIAVICLASIVIPLATLGIREYKSPTKARDFREGVLGAVVVKLGGLPKSIGPFVAVASIAIFFGGLVVEEELVLQTDPVQWVNQDSQSIKDFRKIESETGSGSELAIYITSDGPIFTQESVDFVTDFSNTQIEEHPDQLLTATSVVTTVAYLLEIPGASIVTPRVEDVQAAYDVAPEDVQKNTVNLDANAMNLIFRYGEGTLEDRAVVLDEIEATTETPPGLSATPSGLAVVGVGLLENLTSNRVMLTYLAIAFVGIFLAFRLRSIVRAALSLVPVLIAVGAASLVAYALNLKLSPMTAVGGPLVVAVCTEFTSLILLRFLEERRRGHTPQEAADVAAARTGRAFIVSALATIGGVGVIATSSLPLLRDFGLVVGMNVTVALLSALVVLPPLMVWADQRGWVSKGMIPDDVLRDTTPAYRERARSAASETPDPTPA